MAEREPQAWTIKGGKIGEYEAESLERGIALLGFTDIPDLSAATSRESVRSIVRTARPQESDRHHNNVIYQLFAFRMLMSKNDIIAMPLKSIPDFVAVGRVLGDYQRIEVAGEDRHARPVEWRNLHIERANIRSDLLSSLDVRMTVSRPRAENSTQRLTHIYEYGIDPQIAADLEQLEGAVSYVVAQDPEDAILNHIRTQFPGRELERLVAAVLTADGYTTLQADAGPDGGVDVLAGYGRLGFDHPRLCVQVKAWSDRAGAEVIRSTAGTLNRFGADHGLIVSWSGFTKEAKKEARASFFTMRLWDARDLLNAIYRNYDRLPDEIRAQIPLQQVWTLLPDDDL